MPASSDSVGAVVSSGVRRALARASRGETLNTDELVALVSARGADLRAVQAAARDVRERALDLAGRPGVLTYSPKVFIPLTRLCRDRCHYCTFATDPASLRRQGHDVFLTLDEVVAIARAGVRLRARETSHFPA